jgi:hypothetical protein
MWWAILIGRMRLRICRLEDRVAELEEENRILNDKLDSIEEIVGSDEDDDEEDDDDGCSIIDPPPMSGCWTLRVGEDPWLLAHWITGRYVNLAKIQPTVLTMCRASRHRSRILTDDVISNERLAESRRLRIFGVFCWRE